MDSVYEVAGAQASTAFLTALWALGLPVIIACAGIAWRVHRVAEDGLARPLAVYLLSLILIAWLLRPVPQGEGVSSPRFVAWLNEGCDIAVTRSITLVDREFLVSPFQYERIAAVAATAHAQDPRLREDLAIFFATCTANAMAKSGVIDAENPVALDSPLPYGGLSFGTSTTPCTHVRGELWSRLLSETENRPDLEPVWKAGVTKAAFVAALVRNEWHGRVADGGEMVRVRGSIGSYAQTGFELQRRREPAPVPYIPFVTEVFGPMIQGLATLGEEVLTEWGYWGELSSDRVTSRQRYFLVTSYAPTLYGLILMLLTSLFPVAALWSLVPGKWTALVNFGKVFVSVKLWPLGWSLVSSFSARRPIEDALSEHAPPSDVFTAVTLMYFLIPALSFIVVNLGTAAAAIPFKEAAPSVAGPGNGPMGQVSAMAVNRIR